MCTIEDFEYILTWEISRGAEGRRWFYKKLERLVSQIPKDSCKKIGGSVYLVRQEYVGKFEELLSEFNEDGFSWHIFEIQDYKTSHV